MIEAPKPGLYRDVPPDVYHSWDAVNASALADLCKVAPAQMRWNQLNPKADSDALAFGSLFHTAILEPDTLAERYVVEPRFNRACKDASTAIPKGYAGGKLEADAFARDVAASGKMIVGADDLSRAYAMRDAAYAHPLVRQLLGGVGVNEASLVWQDPIHDLPCKLRVDRLVELNGRSYVIDVKTAASASPSYFSRAIENHGYHIRAAWYLRGLREVATAEREYLWIVFDKAAPFLPAVYQIDPDDLAEGAGDCARLLAFYAHCRATDTWPGYTEDQVEVCTRPRWARRAPESEAEPAEIASDQTYDEGGW